MNILSRMPIAVKLPLIMVGLTLAALLATGIFAYIEARDEAREQAETRLSVLSQGKSDLLAAVMQRIGADLMIQAGSPTTINAIRDFGAAFAALPEAARTVKQTYISANPEPAGERNRYPGPAGGNGYDRVHRLHHNAIDRLRTIMGYYDVFLIDLDGNVVYTVYKEADFGDNLRTGPLKDSGLGRVFAAAVDNSADDTSAFDDFSPYGPSAGAASSFMARPVFDENGARMGVVAFQLPTEVLNTAVQNVSGLSESGSIYLVGPDGWLRSSRRGYEGSGALSTRVDNPAVSAALAGGTGLTTYVGPRGGALMAHYEPVTVAGQTWALVVDETLDELMKSAEGIRQHFIVMMGVTGVFAVVLSVLMARSLTVPFGRITAAMRDISEKRYQITVPGTARGDEIGEMARTLDAFRNALIEAEVVALEAAFQSGGFQHASAAMLMVDEGFKINYMNDAMVAVFDERAEDFRALTGVQNARDLIGVNMDRFHAVPERVRKIVSRPENLPMRAVIKVGRTFFSLMIAPILNKEGKVSGLVLEWKNETKSLRDSTIISALDANSVRIEITQGGKIGWANSFVCKRLGRKVEELLDLDADTILGVRPVEGERPPRVSDIAQSRETVTREVLLSVNGRQMRIDANLTPMNDPQGKPAGVVLVGADVTEERNHLEAANTERARNERDQALVVEGLRQGLTRLSDGDLTARITSEFATQYEQLRSDFNAATIRLEGVIGQIVESATAIRTDTESISSASQTLSKRTESQAATLEETAAALDQLTGSVRTAAEGATSAAELVRETRRNVETSGGVVHEAVDAMGEIEKFSNQISSISGVIDEIAFQTNLLALNAGVEAARAGDAGRGFAVVASEVRALAQRSSDAAREINSLISSSGAQIKRGVTLVSKAGQVLTQMLDSVSSISGSVESIAQSASEQSRGLQEINSAVNQLDRVTQQNAAMFEQTTAASLALAGEAEGLTLAMNRFNIGSGSPSVMETERQQAVGGR
ncbi:MAG: HAMP domain-containing protein [Pseudooceanicola sp.]|nr:HAMP domain-containing protein [Pseudooceanicola sp.]